VLFNTWEFFAFLSIVLALYYLLRLRWQNILLLVASYVFYGFWDWRFTVLLLLSTVVDYFLALRIHHADDQTKRKRLLFISILFNLGMLGFFKYFNFFVSSAASTLSWMGFEPHLPVLSIILPAGISFYTFQTMNYVIDVYARKMEPTRDFLTYALFVSYFPHLVAGPIIRAELLLPQLSKNRRVTNEHWRTGGLLILVGLFKKVVVADTLAPDVEEYFTAPNHFSSLVLLQGLYSFSMQIYYDFSGYTDIARGVSRLLGIELPENFNQPYLSQNIAEFWRRWHISLSSWLRDYVYIPLGGNRLGRWRTYLNLLITMVLGGLWHGANWTFVVWGTLHGVYLASHKFMMELWPQQGDRPRSPWLRVVAIVTTFHLVTFTWIFFRAPNFHTAFAYLTGILQFRGALDLTVLAKPLFFMCVVLIVDMPQYLTGNHTVALRLPWFVRGCAYAVMIFGLVLARTDRELPFIYFQF
jgi:alginate O-acetyltransferase complex protein AlgI